MILWIVGLIVNFNLLAVRTGQSSGINLQVTRWRRLGLEGIWMFDFNPPAPTPPEADLRSRGEEKDAEGLRPSARPDAVTVQDLHCDALEMTPDPDSDS